MGGWKTADIQLKGQGIGQDIIAFVKISWLLQACSTPKVLILWLVTLINYVGMLITEAEGIMCTSSGTLYGYTCLGACSDTYKVV